jgi:serine/threonine protein kinase
MIIHEGNSIENVKIVDFGFAEFKEVITENDPRCGTPNFIAPEVYQNKPYDYPSDIFSVGVIIFYSLTLTFPFGSTEPELIIKNTLEEKINYDGKHLRHLSVSCKNFLKKLLKKDPNKRAKIDHILTHEWL